MSVCEKCGQKFDAESGKQCPQCRRQEALQKAKLVWKKQMKFYGATMVVGLLILGFVFPQLQDAHHGEASRSMYVYASIGGLCLLGGMFGFALALFFQLWHGKPE